MLDPRPLWIKAQGQPRCRLEFDLPEDADAVVALAPRRHLLPWLTQGRVQRRHHNVQLRQHLVGESAALQPDRRATIELLHTGAPVPGAVPGKATAVGKFSVSLPDGGGMGLVLPTEAQATPAVWNWLEAHVAGNGPIRRLLPVNVRQSMANGGGPACLRLRVVADPATVDPRFIANEAKLDQIASVVAAYWPESIVPDQLGDASLMDQVRAARMALLTTCDLTALA